MLKKKSDIKPPETGFEMPEDEYIYHGKPGITGIFFRAPVGLLNEVWQRDVRTQEERDSAAFLPRQEVLIRALRFFIQNYKS